MMKKQTVEFAVESKDGVVTGIGRSSIYIPKTRYGGGKTKWYDDSRLLKK